MKSCLNRRWRKIVSEGVYTRQSTKTSPLSAKAWLDAGLQGQDMAAWGTQTGQVNESEKEKSHNLKKLVNKYSSLQHNVKLRLTGNC